MKINKKRVSYGVALAIAGMASAAHADSFINGSFEDGTTSGWTIGGGSRTPVGNSGLNPADFLAGGTYYNLGIAASHSAVVGTGYVDPRVGAALGSTVYSGNYSLRVEDTNTGGFASVATQTVLNYTDPEIFFAWKAVLLGAHGADDAATMVIKLTDTTTNTVLITRQYNAATVGGNLDSRWSLLNNNYYTAQWQIEQLSIDASLSGHNFVLSVLAADCQPTAHYGYVYLDGFGAVIPPPSTNVPEPGTLGLAGLGLVSAALSAVRRRKQRQA